MPTRVVAIGDLNGADDALVTILRGTRLIGRNGYWRGGRAHLVQVGDLFNRGSGGKAAFERLLRLRSQARRVGGEVTVLLGNHEVMTALGNEAYCTEEEYLSFATKRQIERWPSQRHQAMMRIYRDYPPQGPILPLEPRLAAWAITHVPGRAAMRRSLSRRGRLGRALRKLPVACRIGETVFVHAGLDEGWAALGVDGLNQEARRAWDTAPQLEIEIPDESILRDGDGPLWNRSLVREPGARLRRRLRSVLSALGAERLVVGHTQTSRIPGGREGRIVARASSRLIGIDVGIQEGHGPRTALLIQGGNGFEWTPEGRRRLW